MGAPAQAEALTDFAQEAAVAADLGGDRVVVVAASGHRSKEKGRRNSRSREGDPAALAADDAAEDVLDLQVHVDGMDGGARLGDHDLAGRGLAALEEAVLHGQVEVCPEPGTGLEEVARPGHGPAFGVLEPQVDQVLSGGQGRGQLHPHPPLRP